MAAPSRARGAAAVVHYEPPPPSPIVKRLRQMWQFAAISQFLFTFDEAFGVVGFEIDALENDLDGSETEVIPNLFRRLLYTLTLNKNLSNDNWEEHLRKQYALRDPERNPLGTAEEPRSWAELSLTQKVIAIHSACEWQFQDAERFRKIIKTEEGAEAWRIDPIGWDSQDNTYWLYDDNRLWVQHPPPRPKAPEKPAGPPRPPKKGSKAARREAKLAAAQRKAETSKGAAVSSGKRGRDSDASASASATDASSSRKRTRTAPSGVRRNAPRAVEYDPRAGMRTSRRLRALDDEGWQAVPPELLADGSRKDENDESDLSDLSSSRRSTPAKQEQVEDLKEETRVEVQQEEEEKMDVDNSQSGNAADESRAHGAAGGETTTGNETTANENGGEKDAEMANGEAAAKEESQVDIKKTEEPDFLEFEAIAITRSEWLAMGERFAKSRDPNEKALHNLLKNEILPKIIADLDEADRVRDLEAKLANRKRSSRIALKESEREERERDRVARIAMEERMAAVRAEEALRIRREREAIELEQAREARAREREDRLLAREFEAMERARMEEQARLRKERERERRKKRRDAIIANGGIPPPPEAEDAEGLGEEEGDWELGCEACGQRGINLSDPSEMVCCEACGIWQHVSCWNAWRRKAELPPLDWATIDFYCSKCRPPPPGEPLPPFPANSASSAGQPVAPAPTVPSNNSAVGVPSQGFAQSYGANQHGPIVPSQTAFSPQNPPLAAYTHAPRQAQGAAPGHIQLPPQPYGTAHGSFAATQQAYQQQSAMQQPQQYPSAPLANPVVPSAGERYSVAASQPAQAATLQSGSPAAGAAGNGSSVSPSGAAAVSSPVASPGAGGHKRSPSYSRPSGPSPSGSFPIRRDITARSPLSGPHDASGSAVPVFSLARPRAPSPSPMAAPNGGLQRGAVTPGNGAAPGAASRPLSNGASSSSGNASALYQRQNPTANGTASHAGPGPTTGSLAGSKASESPRIPAPVAAGTESSTPATAGRPRAPSEAARSFGPSPHREPYGASLPGKISPSPLPPASVTAPVTNAAPPSTAPPAAPAPAPAAATPAVPSVASAASLPQQPHPPAQ